MLSLTTFFTSSSIDCTAISSFYKTAQLSDGTVGCCDSPNGNVNVNSCVAHADDLKAMARIGTYKMNDYYNLTEFGKTTWMSQDPASYADAGSPPVGAIGTMYDFRRAPFGVWNERIPYTNENVQNQQLIKVSGSMNFPYFPTLMPRVAGIENMKDRKDMVKHSTFDARTDLIYSMEGFHNGFDPFDHLKVHDAHTWEFDVSSHKDLGGSGHVISTTKTYGDAIVEFTIQYTKDFRPVYREQFHPEGKEWPTMNLELHSLFDNSDRNLQGSLHREHEANVGKWKALKMRLSTNGGAFGKLESTNSSWTPGMSEGQYEYLTFTLNSDAQYFPGRDFQNWDPFHMKFMFKGSHMSLKINDKTVLYGKELGTESGVDVTATPDVKMDVGYIKFINQHFPFKVSNMKVSPLTDEAWNQHVSSVAADYNYNPPKHPVYMWRNSSSTLGLEGKANTMVYQYQMENLDKTIEELIADNVVFRTAAIPYWVYQFCMAGGWFCEWYNVQEGHAYVLEKGVDLGVGWAAQPIADWLAAAGTSLVHRPPLLTQTGIDHLRTSLPEDVKAKIPAETLANLRPNDPVPEAAYFYECYVIGNEILGKPSVEACIVRNLQAQYWIANGLYKD